MAKWWGSLGRVVALLRARRRRWSARLSNRRAAAWRQWLLVLMNCATSAKTTNRRATFVGRRWQMGRPGWRPQLLAMSWRASGEAQPLDWRRVVGGGGAQSVGASPRPTVPPYLSPNCRRRPRAAARPQTRTRTGRQTGQMGANGDRLGGANLRSLIIISRRGGPCCARVERPTPTPARQSAGLPGGPLLTVAGPRGALPSHLAASYRVVRDSPASKDSRD